MHESFVDWFRLVDPDPTGETLKSRWQGIEDFARKQKGATWLDTVRVFTGVPPNNAGFVTDFVAVFKEIDPTFTATDNDLLLQVLAGATLMKVLDGRSARADLIAAALLCVHCRGAGRKGAFPAPIEAARSYIAERGRTVRTATSQPADPPKISKYKRPVGNTDDIEFQDGNHPNVLRGNFGKAKSAISELQDAIGTIHQRLNALVEPLNEIASIAGAQDTHAQLEVVREEADVLWWIFGKYSRDLKQPVEDLGFPGGVVVAGKELADLTRLVPGPISTRAFLDAMIRQAGEPIPSELRLVDAVNATPESWREAWLDGLNLGGLSGVAPVLTAVEKSLETPGADDWIAAFEKASIVDSDVELSPLDLGEQVYEECLLVRLNERAI